MANVGDKFIVEVDGIIGEHPSFHQRVYSIKNFGNGCILEGELDYLEKYKENPFTQSDCDNTRSEGFRDGLKQGREEAWETAKRIVLVKEKGGLSNKELFKIFGTTSMSDIFTNNTAKEANSKIKAYEEQKKKEEREIKVGDEIEYDLFNGTVKGLVLQDFNNGEGYKVLCSNGCCQIVYNIKENKIAKTGRHFDIEGILKAMREE